MEIVCLETTVVSYLASRPSRDLVVSAHQQITHDWWGVARERFKIRISEAVLEEIGRGDPDVAKRREEIVKDIPIYELNEDVRKLVGYYEKNLGLPQNAKADLLHISFVVSYEVIRRLLKLNKEIKKDTPLILTPDELLEPLSEKDI